MQDLKQGLNCPQNYSLSSDILYLHLQKSSYELIQLLLQMSAPKTMLRPLLLYIQQDKTYTQKQ
jgi:hypothetical protein